MKKPKSSSICSKTEFFVLAIFLVAIVGVCVFYGAAFPKKYEKEVNSASERFSVSPFLLYAVIKTESGFDTSAVSDKGAIGLMQILPSTAEYVSEKFFDGEVFDLRLPRDNIELGCAYIRYLKDKFKNDATALAAYNAGEGNVAEWLKDENLSLDGQNLGHIPFGETREYVEKVLKREKIYRLLYEPHC